MWKLKLLLRRLAGFAYDLCLLAAVLFSATAAVLPLNGGRAFETGQWVYPAYLGMVVFVFVGWFWTHGGQTLGMRAWRLRLVTADGQAVGWGHVAARFAAACFSIASFGLGYWWILFDAEGLAWHDRLSRTRVQFDGRALERDSAG